MECYIYLRNVTDLLSDGKTSYERRFRHTFKGPIISFVHCLNEYHPITTKDQSRVHQFGKKVLPELLLGYVCTRREFGRMTYWLQTLRSWRRCTHQKSTLKDSIRRRWYFPKEKENLFFQSKMDVSNLLEEIWNWQHPSWYGDLPIRGKEQRDFLGESERSPPPSILRKSSDMRNPIRRVKFTKVVLRHANIRDQNPSLGLISQGVVISVNPMLQNLRIGLRKRRNDMSDVSVKQRVDWSKVSKKLKEKSKVTVFSSSENSRLPASTLKSEEGEFIDDSDASMHMISKKDLNDAEMDILTKSCSPTTVI